MLRLTVSTDPTEDDHIIHEMEVYMVVESLEERGLITRFDKDGDEYYMLTPEGELEAMRIATNLGFDSVEELREALYEDYDEDELD